MVAHAVLPVAVLTFWYGGRFLRYVRDAMAEVMAADFIRPACGEDSRVSHASPASPR